MNASSYFAGQNLEAQHSPEDHPKGEDEYHL